MAEKKKSAPKVEGEKQVSRTSIMLSRPKKYDTRYKPEDGKRKYPPKTL